MVLDGMIIRVSNTFYAQVLLCWMH